MYQKRHNSNRRLEGMAPTSVQIESVFIFSMSALQQASTPLVSLFWYMACDCFKLATILIRTEKNAGQRGHTIHNLGTLFTDKITDHYNFPVCHLLSPLHFFLLSSWIEFFLLWVTGLPTSISTAMFSNTFLWPGQLSREYYITRMTSLYSN